MKSLRLILYSLKIEILTHFLKKIQFFLIFSHVIRKILNFLCSLKVEILVHKKICNFFIFTKTEISKKFLYSSKTYKIYTSFRVRD